MRYELNDLVVRDDEVSAYCCRIFCSVIGISCPFLNVLVDLVLFLASEVGVRHAACLITLIVRCTPACPEEDLLVARVSVDWEVASPRDVRSRFPSDFQRIGFCRSHFSGHVCAGDVRAYQRLRILRVNVLPRDVLEGRVNEVNVVDRSPNVARISADGEVAIRFIGISLICLAICLSVNMCVVVRVLAVRLDLRLSQYDWDRLGDLFLVNTVYLGCRIVGEFCA